MKTPRKNANPEHKLQVAVRQYLLVALPPSVEWTANGAGQALSIYAANKAKAAGVRRGWPDLQFLFPDGITRYIELKTAAGSLSPEQRAFRDRCYAIRPAIDIWALCRSVEDVAAVLTRWGVTLRAHPFVHVGGAKDGCQRPGACLSSTADLCRHCGASMAA